MSARAGNRHGLTKWYSVRDADEILDHPHIVLAALVEEHGRDEVLRLLGGDVQPDPSSGHGFHSALAAWKDRVAATPGVVAFFPAPEPPCSTCGGSGLVPGHNPHDSWDPCPRCTEEM